jgi:hypothetical protein
MEGVKLSPVEIDFLTMNFPQMVDLINQSCLPYTVGIEEINKIFFSSLISHYWPQNRSLWTNLWQYYIFHNKVESTVEELLRKPTTERVLIF